MTRYTRFEELRSDFVTRGLVLLHPDDLQIDASVHEEIYKREIELFRAKQYISAENLPEILTVLESPGLVKACDILLDKGWAIVPFTHNTPFISGAFDQHWHKDDNGPYNARRSRFHQPIQIEMLYYPQAVGEDMGPTATLPYSQYWTLDSEENHDNFAGADHIDFAYQIEGWESVPISGKRSRYEADDVVTRNTEHDERMRKACADLEWPFIQPFEAAPLEAGSVVLYSHNLFHRGNHRRDDWQTWREKPRFMWRFWLYRVQSPTQIDVPLDLSRDVLTNIERGEADLDLIAVWQGVHQWWGGREPQGSTDVESDGRALYEVGEQAEPIRVGAAYRLGASYEFEILAAALNDNRESVRRAATYGLVSVGEEVTDILLRACESQNKWTRKAGVFGLGIAAYCTQEVLNQLLARLLHDQSAYVRSYAADAVGQFVRRTKKNELVDAAVEGLLASLAQESNRLSMDRAQTRNIKFVRPTDECDICEGIGITLGYDRFEPVRSVVRENTLTSLVIASQHDLSKNSRLVESLMRIAREDKNIFSTGLALDVLVRVLGPEDDWVKQLMAEAETLCWPSLVRTGASKRLASP